MKKLLLWGLAVFFGLPAVLLAISFATMSPEEKAQIDQQVQASQAAEAQARAANEEKRAQEKQKRAKEHEARMLVVNLCTWSQDAVKARLRAPATAQFPDCVMGLGDYTIRSNEAGTNYIVLGHVDSQNGFGALLRSKFAVKFARPSPNAQFTITQVAVE